MNQRVYTSCVAALLSMIAVLLIGCTGNSPEALLASAKELLAKNDSKAAVIQLKNVLQKKPDTAEARFLLGKILLEGDDAAAAERELRKARDLNYPPGEVNPLLARALVKRSDYKRAIDEFAGADASTPEGVAQLQTAIGDAQLARSDTKAAAVAFAAALRAQPRYAHALLGEARLKAIGGDLAGALDVVRTVVASAPTVAEGWQLEGDLLLADRQPDEALGAYRKAVEAKPVYLPAHFAIVSMLAQQGKLDDADKALATLKEAAPKHVQTAYLEAMVRFRQQNLAAAREAIQQHLKLAPASLPGTLLSGAIDYGLQSYAQAEASLIKVLQRAPNQDYARRLLIGTYLQSGQPAKALETLKPVLDRIDKNPDMLGVAGEVYLHNGDPRTAAQYFEKSSAIAPDNFRQRTSLALSHIAGGDAERGVRELEETAAVDTGIRADLMLIAASFQNRQYDKALRAIDALEKKQPGKPLPHNMRGAALLAKKDTVGARKSFEHALELDPSFFPAVLNLARLDIAAKKPEDAQKRFEAVVAKNPKNAQALLALAELKAGNGGSADEVAGLINKAIAADAQDIAPRLALVNHYLRTKNPTKAIAVAQESTSAFPGQPRLLEALARAQKTAGNTNQAIATYRRLAEAQPGSPTPFLYIAELQLASKDYDAAAQSLRSALALKPDFVAAQRGLVVVHAQSEHVGQAVAVAREIQKQRPKQSVGYILEGDVHFLKKTWGEAIAAYRNGVKQTGNTDVATKLHAALMAGGQRPEADKMAASWLKEHADDVSFRMYLAQDAMARKEYPTALKYYEALLVRHADSPVILNNFAWVAGKTGDPRALESAEKANALAPKQAATMDTLGTLLVQNGDTVRGIEFLQGAVALAPESPTIRFNLAKGLIKAGQKDAAKKELQELAKLGSRYVGQDEVTQLMKTL